MRLTQRDRFVVDLPKSVYLGSTSQLSAIPGTKVASVRIGQFEPDTVRIVLDLKSPATFPVELETVSKDLVRIVIRTDGQMAQSETKNPSPSATTAQSIDIEQVELRGDEVLVHSKEKLAASVNRFNTPPRVVIDFEKAGLLPAMRNKTLRGGKNIRSVRLVEENDRAKLVVELAHRDAKVEVSAGTTVWRATISRAKPAGESGLFLRRQGKGWQMVLKADDEVSFKIGRLSGNDRLYLDVTGGSFNLPRDSVYVDNGIIARVRVGTQDEKTTRLVMDLDQPVKHTVRLAGDRRSILIGISPDAFEEKVTVDPGHGGIDEGARGRFLKEKEVNLQVALRVQRLMEQAGINVQLTRSKDVEVMLHPRVDMGDNNNSDVFVSIHANSFSNPGVRGIETYYYNPTSLALARAVHSHLVRTLNRPDRGIHRNNFVVVKYNKMPACLVEIGYLSNSEDEALLASRVYQEKAASAITAGVKDFLRDRGPRQ
jgi:N-acetylmuramoyl-L-alanine amidase